jgi:hypothetical protein
VFDDSVVANDRDEARAAARHDHTKYRRIGGVEYDADDVPAPEDA